MSRSKLDGGQARLVSGAYAIGDRAHASADDGRWRASQPQASAAASCACCMYATDRLASETKEKRRLRTHFVSHAQLLSVVSSRSWASCKPRHKLPSRSVGRLRATSGRQQRNDPGSQDLELEQRMGKPENENASNGHQSNSTIRRQSFASVVERFLGACSLSSSRSHSVEPW